MEQQHLCILLHSNYSAICRQLLSALQECPVNIYSLTGLHLLCVDNEKIRKKITQCKKIEITSVPTLLIISGTTLEKYEGQDVFDWIDTIVNKYLPPQEKYSPPPPPLPPPPPQPPSPQEEYEYEYDEEQPPPRKQAPPPRKQAPPPRKQAPPPRKPQPILEDLDDEDNNNSTTIEDLDSDGETEDIPTPPAGVRNGPGGYDLSSNFGKKEERPAQKSNETSDSKSSLMASAMAMQKERESDTDKSGGKQKLM